MPTITDVLNSNPADGEVYSIKTCVIKFVSDKYCVLWIPLIILLHYLSRHIALTGYIVDVNSHWQKYCMFGTPATCYLLNFGNIVVNLGRGRRGRDCMVVECTTTYQISAYNHKSCEFESRWWQHYVMMFVSDLWHVGSFLGYSGFLH